MKRPGAKILIGDDEEEGEVSLASLAQLGLNARKAFSSFDGHAHHKKHLVQLVLPFIDNKKDRQYLTGGRLTDKYIQDALREVPSFNLNPIVTQRYAKGVARATAQVQKEEMRSFIMSAYVSNRSGDTTVSFRLPQRESRYSAFVEYKKGGGNGSASVFYAICKDVGLKKDNKAVWDLFSCPHCQGIQAKVGELNALLRKMRQEKVEQPVIHAAEQQLANLEFHTTRWKHQRGAFYDLIRNVPEEQLVLVIDYATHMLHGDKCPDLIVVAFFRGVDGETVHYYLDCVQLFANAPKKDATFLSAAFNEIARLQMLEPFSMIHVWGDTGFRTTGTLYYFSLLKETLNKEIRLNFFPENHGHNPCDSHQGNSTQMISRAVRKMYNEQDVRAQRVWAMEQISSMSYTHVLNLQANELDIPPTLEGISQFLCFAFVPPKEVLALRFIGEDAKHVKTLTFKIED